MRLFILILALIVALVAVPNAKATPVVVGVPVFGVPVQAVRAFGTIVVAGAPVQPVRVNLNQGVNRPTVIVNNRGLFRRNQTVIVR